ncbi:restriction endonuclease subunit S [Streptococcus mitis]|uniref:Restriction endonuclease subunit S n=1 Tax=Streptococcus mitis TaxID=28037 RepID=A0A6M9F789_STRMT|nr:restriction endonuclease subunit S [Streptococcus mitis]QKL32289.1 restriction endonuclease subunit S [Streptococcus mitis]
MTKQPSYRFVGFEDEWKEKYLYEVLKVSKDRNVDLAYDKNQVLSVSREAGVVNQIEYQGRSFAGADLSNYKIVNKENLIYTKSPLKGAPYGIFQISYTTGIVSPLYAVFKSTKQIFAPFVGLSLTDDNKASKYLSPIVTKGAKNTINITDEGSLQGKLLFPSILEQTIMHTFFQDIDQLISIQQRKLEVLKEQKKTYLKLLFPAKGQTKPDLRFAGFEDEWKEKYLYEVLKVSKDRNVDLAYDKNQVLSVSREAGVVNQIEYQGRSFAGADLSNYKIVNKENLIYTKSPLKGAPYGIFQISYTTGIVSPLYAVFKSTKQIFAPFVGLSLMDDNKASKYLSPIVTKGAKNTINITDEGSLQGKLLFPSMEEQRIIHTFFQDLDKSIAKQEEKVNQLKESKQTLLRKMFI